MTYHLKCPVCKGISRLLTRTKTINYDNKLINYESLFYRCNCAYEFTTREIREVNEMRIKIIGEK